MPRGSGFAQTVNANTRNPCVLRVSAARPWVYIAPNTRIGEQNDRHRRHQRIRPDRPLHLAHIAASTRNDIKVAKVNATGPLETAAHLMKYDSVHGRFPGDITLGDGTMDLGRGPMEMFSTYDMDELDWSGVDVVLECTGKFNDGEKAKKHLDRGAGRSCCPRPARTSTAPWCSASTTANCRPASA